MTHAPQSLLHRYSRRLWQAGRALAAATRGNVAVTFGLLLPALLIGAGVSVDYLRAYDSYSEMQTELDLALIAAIKKINNLDIDELEEVIEDWFAAQTRLNDYSLEDVDIDVNDAVISAQARAAVPTTLMRLAGIDTVPISVRSEVAGPATSYLDVYLVLDKSASMLLAATPADQAAMRSAVGCAFSCHTGEPRTVGGVPYSNYYAYSSTRNVELRSDVMLEAVGEVLDIVEEIDPSGSRIRVGLYRLAATVSRTQSLTFDMDRVRSVLADPSKHLTSATSTDGSFFNTALNALVPMVGTAGDGKTAASPLKLVMMITDGVQSRRSWVTPTGWEDCQWTATPTCPMSAASRQVTPLNPAWCTPIKANGATFATVYTTYLPVTSDWGYNGTVGATMTSSVWTTTWGGVMRPGVSGSITRQAYLPLALEDCATSSAYFMQATDAHEIAESLTTLFKRYLSTVRLTR